MRINLPARYAAMGLLFGALACAGNTARTDDETGAAVDTTATGDTATQNPSGYRGMERDTSAVPPSQTPTDTFIEQQGTGAPQDTAGYSGIERVDTSAQGQVRSDTTGYGQPDTTGYGQPGADTTSYGQPGMDTTGYGQPADTTQLQPDSAQGSTSDATGYDQSQHQQHGDSTGQLQDSTSR